MNKKISELRTDYRKSKLDVDNLLEDPLKQFTKWLEEAIKAEINEPTAMIIATVNKSGQPSSRVVLLKDLNNDGLVFFTNYNSRKGRELAENPNIAALFFWPELERQVRIEGTVEKVSEKISDNYFISRPFDSRISAVISPQSSEIPDRKYLEDKAKELKSSFTEKTLKRPQNWGGYKIISSRFEFWQGRENRLHDRFAYSQSRNKWKIIRLAP